MRVRLFLNPKPNPTSHFSLSHMLVCARQREKRRTVLLFFLCRALSTRRGQRCPHGTSHTAHLTRHISRHAFAHACPQTETEADRESAEMPCAHYSKHMCTCGRRLLSCSLSCVYTNRHMCSHVFVLLLSCVCTNRHMWRHRQTDTKRTCFRCIISLMKSLRHVGTNLQGAQGNAQSAREREKLRGRDL
jgi:hypothetical protein